MVALLQVEGAVVGHLQHADVLDLGVAGLVVLGDAGVDALAAADAAGQVERVDKLDPVHRLEIAHVRPDAVLVLHFVLDPGQDDLHLLRGHLLVVLLEELVDGGELPQLAQRGQAGRDRGGAGREHGRGAQEAAAGDAVAGSRIVHGRAAWVVTGCGMERWGPGIGIRPVKAGRVRIVAGGALLALDRAGGAIPMAARAAVDPGFPVAVGGPVAAGAQERRLVELELGALRRCGAGRAGSDRGSCSSSRCADSGRAPSRAGPGAPRA